MVSKKSKQNDREGKVEKIEKYIREVQHSTAHTTKTFIVSASVRSSPSPYPGQWLYPKEAVGR
jgi:hypothetical protein